MRASGPGVGGNGLRLHSPERPDGSRLLSPSHRTSSHPPALALAAGPPWLAGTTTPLETWLWAEMGALTGWAEVAKGIRRQRADTHLRLRSKLKGTDPTCHHPQRPALGHGLRSPVPHPLAVPSSGPRPCLQPPDLLPRECTLMPPHPPALAWSRPCPALGAVLSIMPIPGASGSGSSVPMKALKRTGALLRGPWAAVPRAGRPRAGPAAPAAGISPLRPAATALR